MILVIARLLNPSSELFISEQRYPSSALPELTGLTGVPAAKPALFSKAKRMEIHSPNVAIHAINAVIVNRYAGVTLGLKTLRTLA